MKSISQPSDRVENQDCGCLLIGRRPFLKRSFLEIEMALNDAWLSFFTLEWKWPAMVCVWYERKPADGIADLALRQCN